MLGDNTTQIRRQCTDVLLLENKKRPADLDNRLVDGLVIACEFQYSVHGMAKSTMDQLYGDQAAVSVFNELFSKFLLRESKRTGNFLTGSIRKVNDIMRPIFEEFSDILQSSDASDHSLARSLGSKRKGNNTKQEASVSPAKSIFSGIDGTALALNNLKIADFIAVTISTLQYETMEDPLKIIYFVDNTIGISAIHSVRAYMDLLASVGADRRRSGDMQPPALGSKLSKVPKGDGNISSSATFLNESELLLNEVRLIDWWKSFCTNKNNAGLAMMRLHNLLLHFIDLKCKELMIRMRHYISSYYRISEEQIMFFRPSGTKLGANTDKVGSVEFAAKLALYGNGRTLAHLLREIESLVLTVAEVVSTATTDASKSQELLSDLLKELIKDFNRTASFFYSGPDNFATTAVSAKQIVVDNTAGISTNGKKRSRVAGSPKTRKLQTPKSVEKGMKMRKKQKKLQFHEGEDDDESEEEDYWDGMF